MIKIFATGGTFDKEYNEIDEKMWFKETHLPDMLAIGRVRAPVSVTTLMLTDSLHITDGDRDKIANACAEAKEEKIVITHGTGTIDKTAQRIAKIVKEKTIVLTGAMTPYTVNRSDALFNLGSALAFAQALPAGVYVAMNGRIFAWDNVRKNTEKGWFEETDGPTT